MSLNFNEWAAPELGDKHPICGAIQAEAPWWWARKTAPTLEIQP
jgi:hypothetical protein